MSPRKVPAVTAITNLSPAGIGEATLRRWTFRARRRIGLTGQVNVVTVTSATSQQLNLAYRRRDRPTNVLSFLYPAGGRRRGEGSQVGEVILCPVVVRREAREQRLTYRQHFRRLLEHGLIHLLDLDHQTSAEQRRWERYERRLL